LAELLAKQSWRLLRSPLGRQAAVLTAYKGQAPIGITVVQGCDRSQQAHFSIFPQIVATALVVGWVRDVSRPLWGKAMTIKAIQGQVFSKNGEATTKTTDFDAGYLVGGWRKDGWVVPLIGRSDVEY